MSTGNDLTFEQKLEAAQKIALQLEEGGLTLDESVKRYEEGITLLKELETEMKNVQQRLTVLRVSEDGTTEEKPAAESDL